ECEVGRILGCLRVGGRCDVTDQQLGSEAGAGGPHGYGGEEAEGGCIHAGTPKTTPKYIDRGDRRPTQKCTRSYDFLSGLSGENPGGLVSSSRRYALRRRSTRPKAA